jgi:hypothetical protein
MIVDMCLWWKGVVLRKEPWSSFEVHVGQNGDMYHIADIGHMRDMYHIADI